MTTRSETTGTTGTRGTTGTTATALPAARTRPDRSRLVLAVIASAQLMTALDATIVNIALPSAQHALGFGDAQRQWVVTAYTVCFAGRASSG